MGIYTDSEIHTSDGRLDSLVRLENGIFCFEFKLDKSAEEALAQIDAKQYLAAYANDPRPKYAIGVNFSTEDKAVEKILIKQR